MIKKNEKGITLITLLVTVVLLAIITTSLATNSYDSMQLSKLTKLENDIEALNDRVAVYFVENDSLPIIGDAYTKSELKTAFGSVSANDGDEYYIIDLSLLDNLTLNYGEEYLTSGTDSYIINTESHIIYYLQGITYKGDTYYTIGDNSTVTLDI